MPNAHDTVTSYFNALVARDAETLIEMMLPATHYVKIGTDADEVVEGSAEIAAYYRNHVASTEDFSINFIKLDVQERDRSRGSTHDKSGSSNGKAHQRNS